MVQEGHYLETATAPPLGDDSTSPLLAHDAMVDHFRVLRLLGRGGMGEVYLGRDTKLGRKVALKVVRAAALGDQESLQRFLLEARITAQFNHPHIVTIYAVGEHAGCPYVALEFLEGENLRQRLETQPPGVKESIRFGAAIASALVEAHSHQVLHRDLKPENVIIPKDGRLRVVDFGLAKAFSAPSPPQTEAKPTSDSFESQSTTLQAFETSGQGLLGTPLYMAPEQWLRGECGPKTDVWALGVVLWEMLQGRHPLTNCSFFSLCARVCSAEPMPVLDSSVNVLPEVASIVARCLNKVADQRPSAEEVLGVLDATVRRELRTLRSGQSPFRGLLPFTEQSADGFFGRDSEIAAFLERLRQQAVLPVVGPSGAGKSSFVQAGIVPRLREQGRWLVLSLRPGRQPLEALATRLLRGETRDSDSAGTQEGTSKRSQESSGSVDELRARLQAAPACLALQLQTLAEREQARVLLFVDQLEEVQTLASEEAERQAFLRAIFSAADDAAGPVRVVFTLRDDFLGRLAQDDLAREVLSQVTVLRSPRSESLEEVMRRPVEAACYDYDDPSLVSEMIAAVRDEAAALPLLQFAGQALWDKRDRGAKRLTRAAYEEIGGVAGALAHHADGVLAGLPAGQESLARELLVRLVNPDHTRRVVPRCQLLEGLAAEAPDVLDRLVRARLVLLRKARGEGEDAEVEIVHESLIRNWARLARWIEDSGEEIAFLTEVNQAAVLWEKRGRREEEVWEGEALREALRLSQSLVSLGETAQRFLDAGVRRQQRQVRRRRALLASGFSLLAVVAVVSTVVALTMNRQKQTLSTQKKELEHRSAEALREGAQAALERNDLLEARAKLRASLETSDSRAARALSAQLELQPLIWSRKVETSLNRVAFSPDGTGVAATGQGGPVYWIDALTARVRPMSGHSADTTAVAFSVDGKTIVTGSKDNRVGLWEVSSGVPRFVDHGSHVFSLALSSDGRWMVTGGSNGKVILWDFPACTQPVALGTHTGAVWALAFGPEAKVVASAGADATVRLWNAATASPGRVFRSPRGEVTSLALSPDGNTLVSGHSTDGLGVWDPGTGAERMVLPAGGGSLDLAFSPDGRLLADAGTASRIQIRTTSDLKRPPRFLRDEEQGTVNGLAFSPDSRLLVSAGEDKTVRLWNLADYPSRSSQESRHTEPVSALGISIDDDLVVSGGKDGMLVLRDRKTGVPVLGSPRHNKDVTGLAFSSEGRVMASVGGEGTVYLWQLGARLGQVTLVGDHHNWASSAAFSPDSRLLATAGTGKTIRVWNLDSPEQSLVLQGSYVRVQDLAFAADGKQLSSLNSDGTIHTWDLRARRVAREYKPSAATYAFALAVAPDKALLAAVSGEAGIRLTEVESGRSRFLGERTSDIAWGTVSRGATHVGALSPDAPARVWDTRGGTAIVLRGRFTTMNISLSGKYVATGGEDATVRLWDSATGRPLWRAPYLGANPPELLTHRGWTRLDSPSTPVLNPSARWRALLEQEAGGSARSPDGGLLCLRTYDDKLILWNLAADTQVLTTEVRGLQTVVALPTGCAALTREGQARLFLRKGWEQTLLDRGASAITFQEGEILLTAASQGQRFDPEGVNKGSFPGVEAATAVGRIGEWIAVGQSTGRLTLLPFKAGLSVPPRDFSGAPPIAVEKIIPGPEGTLIAGFANGFVGLWDSLTGVLLRDLRLHGSVAHLLVENDKLYAATDVGDHDVLDLSVLRRDYCDLLREVWRRVPVAWENGAAVASAPNKDHRCWLPAITASLQAADAGTRD